VFFEGKPLAGRERILVFRSKAYAYAFLDKEIGSGWSRSHEVRTIWQPAPSACPPSTQNREK
jgi:hypothetical protein